MFEIVRSDNAAFDKLWLDLWNKDKIQHPYYQPFTRAWFKEFEPKGREVEDLSFVGIFDGKAILGVLLMVYVDKHGNYRLSCSGKNIIYIEELDDDYATLNSTYIGYKKFKKEMDGILNEYPTASMIFWDHLYNNQLSFFGRYLLNRGAIATPYLTQVINLTNENEILHANLRKSYKSLINWGSNNLEIKLINHNSIAVDDIENFRLIHLHAAGKETRSKKSWQLQYDMVVNNEAFLILGELDKELVTGMFMLISPKFCYYGIGASKRELFNKPLSHALMWKSILYAKNEGCQYFEVGDQVYPKQSNKYSYGSYEDNRKILPPDDKYLKISQYKRGFGGKTIIRLDIRW